MADRDLYEWADPQPHRWIDAEVEGLLNCPDAGGWLRRLPFDEMVERMVEVASPEAIANLRYGDVPAVVVEMLRRRCKWLLHAALNEGKA